MIASLILAAACIADTTTLTPTPTIAWDALPTTGLNATDGYSLYWRYPGGTFQRLVDLPCDPWDSDGDEIDDAVQCRGVDWGLPVQRARSDEGVEVEFCVEAYNEVGRSPTCSNVLRICMPQVWQPGEIYQ